MQAESLHRCVSDVLMKERNELKVIVFGDSFIDTVLYAKHFSINDVPLV